MSRSAALWLIALAAGIAGGGHAEAWTRVAADGLLGPVLLAIAGMACVLLALPVGLALAASRGVGR